MGPKLHPRRPLREEQLVRRRLARLVAPRRAAAELDPLAAGRALVVHAAVVGRVRVADGRALARRLALVEAEVEQLEPRPRRVVRALRLERAEQAVARAVVARVAADLERDLHALLVARRRDGEVVVRHLDREVQVVVVPREHRLDPEVGLPVPHAAVVVLEEHDVARLGRERRHRVPHRARVRRPVGQVAVRRDRAALDAHRDDLVERRVREADVAAARLRAPRDARAVQRVRLAVRARALLVHARVHALARALGLRVGRRVVVAVARVHAPRLRERAPREQQAQRPDTARSHSLD